MINTTTTQIVIIGGGTAGLTTARILQQQGVQVTILDKGRGIETRDRKPNGDLFHGKFIAPEIIQEVYRWTRKIM